MSVKTGTLKLCLLFTCFFGGLFLPSQRAWSQDSAGEDAEQDAELGPKRRRRARELWLIFRYENNDDKRQLRVLWPLYESTVLPQSQDHEWSLLWPLIQSERQEGVKHRRALPFYWQTDSKADSRLLFAPFFYSYRNDQEDRAFGYGLPNFWYQRHGASQSWHIFPFLGMGRDGQRKQFWSALYPLFRGQRDEALGRSEYDIFWPFAGHRSDSLEDWSWSWSPVHYYSRQAQATKLLAPLYGHHRDQEGRLSSALLPFYLSSDHWLSENSKDFYTPLYWQRAHDDGRESHGLWPLYWNESGTEGGHRRWILPGFWSARSGESSQWHALPLYFSGRDKDSQYRHLAPLYWSSEAKDESFSSFLPFYYKSRSKDHRTDFVPFVYWHQDSPEQQRSLYGPFVYRGRDKVTDQSRFVVAPFYWSSQDRSGSDSQGLLPFYWRSQSPSQRHGVYGPFVYEGEDLARGRRYCHVAPLYWSTEKADGTGSNMLLPFYWRQRSVSGADCVYSPFVYAGHDDKDQSSYLHIAPFYWSNSSKSGAHGSTWVLPFYWSRVNSMRRDRALFPFLYMGLNGQDGQSYFHAPPVYWQTRDKAGHGTTAVLPFYWSQSSEESEHSAALPFVYSGSYRDGSKYLHLAPFYWSWSTPESHKWAAFPFVYHGRLSDGRQSTVLPPLFWRFRDSEGLGGTTLLPLYWNRRSSTREDSLLFPFLYKGQGQDQSSYLHVAPFYWSTQSGRDHSTFIPGAYWRSRSELSDHRAYGPFVYTGESSAGTYFHAAPLYWSTEDYDGTGSNMLLPLYWQRRSKTRTDGVYSPFVYAGRNDTEQSSYLHVAPFYWSTQSGPDHSTFIPGAYWRSRSELSDHRAYGPFVYTGESSAGRYFHAAPFFWSTEMVDGTGSKMLLPFYWRQRSKSGAQGVYSPFVYAGHNDDDQSSYLHIAPFYWSNSSKSGAHGSTWALPFYWSRVNNMRRDRALFPFLYMGLNGQDGQSYAHFAPFYWSWSSPQSKSWSVPPLLFRGEDADGESYFHAPLVYWQTRDKAGHGTTAVLPFYWSQSSVESRDTAATPFIWWGHDDKKQSAYFHLPPFYFSRESKDQSSTMALPFYYHSERKDQTASTRMISPLVWQSQSEQREDLTVLPFYLSGADNAGSSYRHILPLYGSWESAADSERLDVLLPCFWRRTRAQQSDWAVAPLVFGGQDQDGGYLHLAPLSFNSWSSSHSLRGYGPFVWSYKDQQSRSFHAFPVFHGQWRENDSWMTLLGLFWRSEEGQASKTLILPFYYGHKDPENDVNNQHILPLFHWRRRGNEHNWGLLWPLSHFERRDSESTQWILPLYFSQFSGSQGFRVALPLLWDFQSEDSRSLHIWPFAHYARDADGGRVYSTLWPMISYEKGPGRSAFSVRPFWSRTRNESVSVDALYPLFYSRRQRDQSGRRFWFMWPLFDNWREGEDRGSSVMFYLFRHQANARERSTQLLWRLGSFERQSEQEKTRFHLLYGFFRYETYQQEGGGDYVSLLGGLLSYDRYGTGTSRASDDGRIFRLFWIPFEWGAEFQG